MIKFPSEDHTPKPNTEGQDRRPASISTISFTDPIQLKNQLLIAMPSLDDPNFNHSVTYVCEHNEEGAMGITINRPLDVTLGDIFDHMKISCSNPSIRSRPVFMGGPVALERGFVLHTPHGGWESTLEITDEIGLTTSKDILQALADGAGPARAVIALGYSGWSEGQLEQELADNTWLTVAAKTELIFDYPVEERWAAAARSLGVDMNLLSGEAGHA
ncbi:YqgE/AlgH family protein [Halothiobacillus sp.]|uniref:YqgE/AlgH family protein n=1 Tax=Halothiobacillus sp. TaxID=1891311 RepID=UPI0026168617|nr:YqgE/AlgH family protein [Halothiobacillus sp.]